MPDKITIHTPIPLPRPTEIEATEIDGRYVILAQLRNEPEVIELIAKRIVELLIERGVIK